MKKYVKCKNFLGIEADFGDKKIERQRSGIDFTIRRI